MKWFFFTHLFTIYLIASDYAIHKPQHSSHEQFSLKLLQSAYKENCNVHICPFAIETTLKTLSLGSYKVTNYDFQHILKNPLKGEEIVEFHQQTMQNLQTALNRGEYTQKQALFVSSSISIDPNFLSQCQKIIPFEILNEDLTKTFGAKIQEWLNSRFKKGFYKFSELNLKETKGKISPITYVDFSLQWKYPFDPLMTSIDSFQYPQEIKVQGIVDMMQQILETDYYEDEMLQAVEIPLENHLACLVFLPKVDSLQKVIDLLSKPLYLKKIASKMKPTAVDLKFPKIHLDTPFFYREALLKMGFIQPFSKLADFRGIDSTHALSIDSPIQICRISFQEAGINTDSSLKQKKNFPLKPDAQMTMNHSFIFFIIDSRDLTVYDMGCYQSPF
jgi:serine protease inhibitor